jgi:glycosyltransferase involved in cell wall biosynthesis
VKRLHQTFAFDLIHAHFTYPDGVVAIRLGEKFGVPVIITEHAPWLPWMADYPKVRRSAVAAFEQCAFQITVSRYVQDTIVHFTGESEKLRVIPVGVDSSIFFNHPGDEVPDPNQILFVGIMRYIKGVDVLFEAMRTLIERRPSLRLVLAGGGYYRDYRLHEKKLRSMARECQIGDHVRFVGMKSPREVAKLMRQSSLLVLPSRAESFGAVLVEALACGRPVVATRCGGPEDIVNERVGILVPKEDVSALVEGIERVLTNRAKYKPANLNRYAIDNFAWDKIARITHDLYLDALDRFH